MDPYSQDGQNAFYKVSIGALFDTRTRISNYRLMEFHLTISGENSQPELMNRIEYLDINPEITGGIDGLRTGPLRSPIDNTSLSVTAATDMLG